MSTNLLFDRIFFQLNGVVFDGMKREIEIT